MPCNLYGPNDNYNLKTSHFFPALIAKAIDAKKNKKKKIMLWGSGKPKRELMYVDDLADACIYFMNKKTKEVLINVGSGHDMSILNYAKYILKKMNDHIFKGSELQRVYGQRGHGIGGLFSKFINSATPIAKQNIADHVPKF